MTMKFLLVILFTFVLSNCAFGQLQPYMLSAQIDSLLRVDTTGWKHQTAAVNYSMIGAYMQSLQARDREFPNARGAEPTHEQHMQFSQFTPVDASLIPTGELRPLDGSPLDFRHAEKIGARINENDEQLKLGKGYDHNYVLNKPAGELGLAARVYEETSGRLMEVYTTEPGMQFYTGNFLDGTITGKGGWTYQQRNGFCMEPQRFPDSPNHPSFPSCVLKAGQTQHSTIMYKFSVR